MAAFSLGLALSACSQDNTQGTSTAGSCRAANTSCTNMAQGTTIPTSSTGSVPLYVGGPGVTGSYVYQNEPLVSVTICTPNHGSSSQCQTISNILLDTGSYGLRVFGSAINSNVQLSQVTVSGYQGQSENLAECALFGSGADWGPVKRGDVLLGSQTATNIPIQVIDINYPGIPSGCESQCPDPDPCTAGFNGILGVGVFAQDCGADCATTNDRVNPGVYLGCDSTNGCYNEYPGNCSLDGYCSVSTPTGSQVVNPIASFASGYNNGVALTLPALGSSGAADVTTGTLTLGIDSPTSVTLLPADPNGMTDENGADFGTTYASTTYGGSGTTSSQAFIDSGSNAIFFPGNITTCSDGSGFFCPSGNEGVTATMSGYYGSPTLGISFSIGNENSLFGTGNYAFNNLGGSTSGLSTGGVFDWGLPFFFGRTVYVGLSGTTSTVNSTSTSGPYWAF